MSYIQLVLGVAAILLSSMVFAEAEAEEKGIQYLQKEWAISNYELSGDAQKESFENLISEADHKLLAYPQSAELYIWRGIIKSTYAGVKGGLGALKYAKSAKFDLEKALDIDATALQGSAYTSLGTLYFNVPGWPIGFGDDEKAEELLKKALEINPNGIDPNYFYGQFLIGEKRYSEAKSYMTKALQAKPRTGRSLADAERREEIGVALSYIRKSLE